MVKAAYCGQALPLVSGFARTFQLASRNELERFLEQVERRAFKQAMFALRNEETALDVVQDAMLRLVASYASRPAGELPMLFQRIVQNAIRDQMRRQKVRRLWMSFVSVFGRNEEELSDPLDALIAGDGSNEALAPHREAEQNQMLAIIEREIARLPARQREAFLMRYWEEMDIAETAAAMGCSEGSVKTHCSRATHTLAAALKARGIKP